MNDHLPLAPLCDCPGRHHWTCPTTPQWAATTQAVHIDPHTLREPDGETLTQ